MPGRTISKYEEDYRLKVYVYGVNSNVEPEIVYFPSDCWDEAIGYALRMSKKDDKTISRLQVIDAWGMLVAQFTHRWIVMGTLWDGRP